MNRIQKRAFIRNMKSKKGLKKKRTKGAFGRLPPYIAEDRKAKWVKKAEKYAKSIVENNEIPQDVVDNKENNPNI